MPAETDPARFFSQEEYDRRRARVRKAMSEEGLDACLIVSPENIYYLCGLDHMGYFAPQLLLVTLEGPPILITRAMERAVVRDQVPDVIHAGYEESTQFKAGVQPSNELPLLPGRRLTGMGPWTMSAGMPTREHGRAAENVPAVVATTCRALAEAGVASGHVGLEKNSSFLPFGIAESIVSGMSAVTWADASNLVDNVRIQQSDAELQCTREAAALSDSMVLSAIANAGPEVYSRDIMAALYATMFRRGGTYPGFVPLVRSTGTLEHEHGTWQDSQLVPDDLLFLEMSGCIRRYHAPMGRLVFIRNAPDGAERINEICREAQSAAAETIRAGAIAGDVYVAWQDVINRAGLEQYRRHHCGYSTGIGYPPSWSGGGVPVGLRAGSDMRLCGGMVFHLMSWLLRTQKGDSFLSDTIVVTRDGCEFLTTVNRDVQVR
jgi:Xaa-Pro dipeptidase